MLSLSQWCVLTAGTIFCFAGAMLSLLLPWVPTETRGASTTEEAGAAPPSACGLCCTRSARRDMWMR